MIGTVTVGDFSSEEQCKWVKEVRESKPKLELQVIWWRWMGGGEFADELELCGGGLGRRKERRRSAAWFKWAKSRPLHLPAPT